MSRGRKFLRWSIDGVLFPFGLRTIEFIAQEYSEIEAIYKRLDLVPERPAEDDGDLE